MKTKRLHCGQLFALVLILLALVTATPALANNGKQEDGEGKYANLTALWWQWVYAQPAIDVGGTNTNPALDSTGAYATAGQEDGIGPGNKFFFLAGTFGVDAVRTVTVPAGKALFFPAISSEVDNAVDPPTNYNVPQLRALAAAAVDTTIASTLYARINGVPLEIFRTKSPTFDYTLPDENSIYDYFGEVGPQFEGRIKPAVADGYWVYVPPLQAGHYLLEFGGANSSGLTINATYHLTIE